MSRTGSTANPPATLASTKTISPILNMRAWPSRSASLPPSSRNPPKDTAYPLTSHCSVVVAMCSPVWMEGSATLTMVKSSTTMNCAMASTISRGVPTTRFGIPRRPIALRPRKSVHSTVKHRQGFREAHCASGTWRIPASGNVLAGALLGAALIRHAQAYDSLVIALATIITGAAVSRLLGRSDPAWVRPRG